jgi:1-acyl-sn-glycerol-3-phosphate acyltransferase
MSDLARLLFFALVVRPIVFFWIGLNTRGLEHLPKAGPALIVANHNSHLDTLALISLYPLRSLRLVHPAAAVDYFLRNRALACFATRIIGIIPVPRRREGTDDPLAACLSALDRNEIVILFPEGSRGEPERLSAFKRGIAHLVRQRPDVPVVPVFLRGFGRVMPKGAWLPVPLFCDIFIGAPMVGPDDLSTRSAQIDFVTALERRFEEMAAAEPGPVWE